MLYEVNVHTLAVNKLFHKPVPGWHGKGGYTAQKQLIIANNGEHKVFDIKTEYLKARAAPKNSDEKGVLASWINIKRCQKPADHWFAGFFDFTTFPDCSFLLQKPVSNS